MKFCFRVRLKPSNDRGEFELDRARSNKNWVTVRDKCPQINVQFKWHTFKKKIRTDGRTNGHTDKRTNERTDGRSDFYHAPNFIWGHNNDIFKKNHIKSVSPLSRFLFVNLAMYMFYELSMTFHKRVQFFIKENIICKKMGV